MTHHEGAPEQYEAATADDVRRLYETGCHQLTVRGTYEHEARDELQEYYDDLPVFENGHWLGLTLSGDRLRQVLPAATAVLRIGSSVGLRYRLPFAARVEGERYARFPPELEVHIEAEDSAPIDAISYFIAEDDQTSETQEGMFTQVKRYVYDRPVLPESSIEEAVEVIATTHQTERDLGLHQLTVAECRALQAIIDTVQQLTR